MILSNVPISDSMTDKSNIAFVKENHLQQCICCWISLTHCTGILDKCPSHASSVFKHGRVNGLTNQGKYQTSTKRRIVDWSEKKTTADCRSHRIMKRLNRRTERAKMVRRSKIESSGSLVLPFLLSVLLLEVGERVPQVDRFLLLPHSWCRNIERDNRMC